MTMTSRCSRTMHGCGQEEGGMQKDELENKETTSDRARYDDRYRHRSYRHHRGSICCERGTAIMDVRRKYFAMREIRLQRRISTTAVAMSVGISGERYLRIEKNDVKHISPTERAMLCSFFQLPEEELFATGLSVGYCSPCRTRVLPKEEIEKMLAAEYGDKLKKRKCPSAVAIR